jgi:hypothetical protein
MKYCSKCGSSCDDGMAYCPRCGTPLETAPAVKKPAPDAIPEFSDTANPDAVALPQAPQKMNVSVLWMVLNIVATVLCCPGFLFTITGIVFSALGSESFKKGDEAAARRNSMISMILFIVGVLAGIAGWFFLIKAFSGFANYSGLYTQQ